MLLAPDGRVFNSGQDTLTRFLDTNGAGSWTNGPRSQFGFRDYGSSVMYGDGKVMITGGGSPPTNTTEVINLLDKLPQLLAGSPGCWLNYESPGSGWAAT
jgi:galactose oxidase